MILTLGAVLFLGTSIVDGQWSMEGLAFFGLCAVLALVIFIVKQARNVQ